MFSKNILPLVLPSVPFHPHGDGPVAVADGDAKTTVVADAEITDYSVAETVAVSG